MSNNKISVIGAGSWGTALAFLLSDKGCNVRLWAHRDEIAREINESHVNSTYLPGVVLPELLVATADMGFAVEGAEMVVFVVPSQFARAVLSELAGMLPDGIIVVCATKGFEEESFLMMSELFAEILKTPFSFACLGGPSFAAETARKMPTAVTVGSRDMHTAKSVQELFSRGFFRVYITDDVIGLQLGGALKNVIALAAGIADGLGFGHNTRAALITRGLAEIVRLGLAMGARQETLYGLCGIGDLLLTSTGDLSRNRTVGLKIGQGMKPDAVISEMQMVAEGVKTSRSAHRLSEKFNVYMPITREVYLILHEGKDPGEAVKNLLEREAGSESGEDYCSIR